MVSHLNSYFKSDEYKRRCKAAFNVDVRESIHNRICTQMNFSILGCVIADRKSQFESTNLNCECTEMSQVEINVLRFVSGACFYNVSSKLRASVENKMISNMYEARINFRCHKFMQFLRVPEAFSTAHSSDPESLKEIIRRQGYQKGLTFVSDEAFAFFKLLYCKIKSLQTFKHIERNPSGLLQSTVKKLEQDEDINEGFCKLFTDYTASCKCEEANAEKYDIDANNMIDILDYEIEESLVMHLLHKAILYMSKVHLSDKTDQFLDTVVKKKKRSSTVSFTCVFI